MIWTDISPKKIYRCQSNTWKGVQHYEPLGKWELKLQEGTTVYELKLLNNKDWY